MSITLGSNLSSLRAERQLGLTTARLGKIYERLSSGQRINQSGDDAAGLAIADSLRSDAKVFGQGIRNFNDGLSLLNIADGAIEQLSSVLIRLSELGEQAANGTYSHIQRKALDNEAQALSQEFARIVQSTEFNNLSLFSGQVSEIRLQGGYGIDGGIASGVGGARGTGTLLSGTAYAMEGGQTYSMALGDVNGDGHLDMVSAGYSPVTSRVTLRLGVGNGSFGVATSFNTGSLSDYAVALGDVNNDGALDIISAGESLTTVGPFEVMLGRGDGTFGTATSFATEIERTNGIALADINGDGNLDLATTGNSAAGAGYATIRLGAGNGTFGPSRSYDTQANWSNDVLLEDINGDKIADLITTGLTGTDGVTSIRYGAGNGTFGSAINLAAESGFSLGLTTGDLNGDGIIDLISAGRSDANDGFATVRLGTGNGNFSGPVSYATEANQSNAVTLGDLNGDGFLDLVTAGRDDTTDGFATVRLGSGSGTFEAATSYTTESRRSTKLKLGDLDGDGVLDLVTAGYSDALQGFTTVRLNLTRDGIQPLLPFSLTSRAEALQAMPIFDRKLKQLSSQRGEIGAFQARLHTGINNLTATKENSLAAESRIRDADIAHESADLVRNQILQQAAAAVLSQANQAPRLALALLAS